MTSFDWKSHYLKGDITFADALQFYLQESGAPKFMLAQYERALNAYQAGDAADLAELFDIAMTKRQKNAVKRETWVSHVRFHVDSFHEQGYPKQDPTKYDGTAFHQAGKLLSRSPSQIFDTYYGKG